MFLVFSLVFSSLLLVFYIVNILELIDNVIENKVPFFYLLKYDFYATPEIVTIILPVSILTAVLLTFSLMSKNNEVIAVQVSGISLLRLALPAVFLGLFLSLAVFFIQENVLPEANRQRGQHAGRDPQAQVGRRHGIRPQLGAGQGQPDLFLRFLRKAQTAFRQLQYPAPGPRISACGSASRPAAPPGRRSKLLLLRDGFDTEFPAKPPRRPPALPRAAAADRREPEVLSPKTSSSPAP